MSPQPFPSSARTAQKATMKRLCVGGAHVWKKNTCSKRRREEEDESTWEVAGSRNPCDHMCCLCFLTEGPLLHCDPILFSLQPIDKSPFRFSLSFPYTCHQRSLLWLKWFVYSKFPAKNTQRCGFHLINNVKKLTHAPKCEMSVGVRVLSTSTCTPIISLTMAKEFIYLII